MPAEIREMTVKYHATAKSSRIWLAISLMLYAVAINYAQSAYLNPIWGYYGFTFSYSELDYRQFTLIIVLMGLCAATLPTHLTKASSVVLLLLAIVVYVPTIVLTVGMIPFDDNSFIGLTIIFAFTFCAASASTMDIKKKINIRMQNSLPSVKLERFLIVGWFLLTVALLINYASIMQFVSIGDIYTQRAASAGGGILMAYAKSYYGGVFSPCLIALGLTYRRKSYYIAGLFGCMILYMIAAQKTVFLLPVAMFALNLMLRARNPFFRSSSFCILVVSFVVFVSIYFFEDNLFAFGLSVEFVLRTLAIPGSMLAKYQDFFGVNGFTWWSHVKGVSLVVDPPAYLGVHPSWPSLGYIIGEYFHGNAAVNENAHLFASDGVAAAGWFGVITMGIVLATWLFLIDKVSAFWLPSFAVLIIFPVANALTNGPFFTVMLSFGGVFWLVLGRFFTRPTRSQARHLWCKKIDSDTIGPAA